MLFNPYFEICSLGFLIVLFLYFFRRDNMLDTSSTLYAVFIVVAIFNLSFDIISAFTLTYAAQVPAWINMVVNPLYLATQIVLCAIFMLYTMALVNYLTHENRKNILLLLLPAALSALFILLSPMHNYIIYIDDAFNYVHGPLYNFIYLVAFFYIFSGLFFVSRYRRRVIRLQYNTILAYVIMTVAAVAFQYFYPQYLVSGMAVTIAIMMMFLTFQNPENFTDNLTGLYAAPAFPLTLDKLINNRKEYGLIVIDINNLKFVNTIYGIQGGDELLAQIGAFMMSSFGANNAFRIKGDRFVGIYTPNSKVNGEAVRKRFEESWNLSGSEAVISVSICQIPMSQYASNRDDVLAIMESATMMLKTMDKGANLDIDLQTADTLYRRLSVDTALQYAIRHST
ncbi:MAG: diguanylate cyclase, partial [Syntrophomonadaceae bacterium]|nr:diguanylate cyclase [Syntrophomonadaceae bacterium]